MNKPETEEEQDLEILKAVAQAWHAHSGSISSTNECDARRLNFQARPSRFKLEARNKLSASKRAHSGREWDFTQSLLDSYELVAVSKRLERGLELDNPLEALDTPSRVHRRKESKNSLRNLFNIVSSRRFNQSYAPSGDNTHNFD